MRTFAFSIVCAIAGLAFVATPSLSAEQNMEECRLARSNPERAIPACGKLLDRAKTDAATQASAFANRGLAYAQIGDLDNALRDLSRAIDLAPQKYAFRYQDRGDAYAKTRDYQKAIADYSEAIRLDPSHAFRFHARAHTYWQAGDLDRALRDFDTSIGLDPKHEFRFNDRGLLHMDRREWDLAIADFTSSLTLNPNSAFAYYRRARAFSNKGDVARGIEDCNKATQLDPRDPEAYKTRGDIYEKTGELSKAASDFETAVTLKPNDAEAAASRDRLRSALAAPQKPALPQLSVAPVSQVTPTGNSSPGQVTTRGHETRVALVIGNSGYESAPHLPNPSGDAESVAAALKRAGFESVVLVKNLGRAEFAEALKRFREAADRADWALVFYAGHGMEIGGVNYLIPTDAKLLSDRDVALETIALDQVLGAVAGAKRIHIVLLDACRNNPFDSRMKRSIATRSVERGLTRVEPNPGTLVVFATRAGETAEDGEAIHSPFTAAFVREIEQPGLEVRFLFDTIRDDVWEATGGHQQPFTYGSLSGRDHFYFVDPK